MKPARVSWSTVITAIAFIIIVSALVIGAFLVVIYSQRNVNEFSERSDGSESTTLDEYAPFASNQTSSSRRHVIAVDLQPPRPHTPFVGDPVTIRTSLGDIQGLRGLAGSASDDNLVGERKVNAFLGVPFARPPIGRLRFQKPQPLEPWTEPITATAFGPNCMQAINPAKISARTPTSYDLSEDCLYLNIWTPLNSSSEDPYPVLIWFFGGGFNGGSANLDETDGRVLAALGDVIVVTANYRTGAFGFLNLKTNDAPGNQGIYDMIAAIKWVREHIPSFGGDPEKITLFGQSAGAIGIGMLMAARNSTSSLFKRAILQSGAPMLPKSYFEQGNRNTPRIVKLLNCRSGQIETELACLQSKSPEEILKAQSALRGEFPFNPSPNDELFPTLPLDVFESQHAEDFFQNQHEVLLGATRDEGAVMLHLAFPETFANDKILLTVESLEEFRELVEVKFAKAFLGPTLAPIIAETQFMDGLRNTTTEALVHRLYRVLGDLMFSCPTTMLAQKLNALGKRVYMFEFAQRRANSYWGEWMGATHGDEYAFIFGHPIRYPERYSPADYVLSERMIDIWSSFARTGRVPKQMNVEWPVYDSKQQYMVLKEEAAEVADNFREDICMLFRRGVS